MSQERNTGAHPDNPQSHNSIELRIGDTTVNIHNIEMIFVDPDKEEYDDTVNYYLPMIRFVVPSINKSTGSEVEISQVPRDLMVPGQSLPEDLITVIHQVVDLIINGNFPTLEASYVGDLAPNLNGATLMILDGVAKVYLRHTIDGYESNNQPHAEKLPTDIQSSIPEIVIPQLQASKAPTANPVDEFLNNLVFKGYDKSWFSPKGQESLAIATALDNLLLPGWKENDQVVVFSGPSGAHSSAVLLFFKQGSNPEEFIQPEHLAIFESTGFPVVLAIPNNNFKRQELSKEHQNFLNRLINLIKKIMFQQKPYEYIKDTQVHGRIKVTPFMLSLKEVPSFAHLVGALDAIDKMVIDTPQHVIRVVDAKDAFLRKIATAVEQVEQFIQALERDDQQKYREAVEEAATVTKNFIALIIGVSKQTNSDGSIDKLQNRFADHLMLHTDLGPVSLNTDGASFAHNLGLVVDEKGRLRIVSYDTEVSISSFADTIKEGLLSLPDPEGIKSPSPEDIEQFFSERLKPDYNLIIDHTKIFYGLYLRYEFLNKLLEKLLEELSSKLDNSEN